MEERFNQEKTQGVKPADAVAHDTGGTKVDALIKIFPQAKDSRQGTDLQPLPTKNPENQQYNKHRHPSLKGAHAQAELGPVKFMSLKIIHFSLSFYYHFTILLPNSRQKSVEIEKTFR